MAKKWTLKDLKITEANRDIRRNQVDRIKESIKAHGYINAVPILVDEDGLIIDGQHRYIACKELGIEPTILQAGNFNLVPVLNSTQLSWSLSDFVKYYAAKGYEDYVILENICKSKKLKPSLVYNMIHNKSVNRPTMDRQLKGSQQPEPIKHGTFKFPDKSSKGLAKLERKIDAILELVSELKLPRTDRLVIAIAKLTQDPNFAFDTMRNKIEYQRARIYKCTTIQEYMVMLANIYNNKNIKKVAV